MKVALVCSHGGHLSEMLQLLPAFRGFDSFFVTYHSPRDKEIETTGRAYFTDNIGKDPFRFGLSFFWALRVLRREKPRVIVSTGSEIAIPFFVLAKLSGVKTIFIEGFFRVEDLSQTGRILYPLSDVFLVQWPGLLKVCGKKARYEGAVI